MVALVELFAIGSWQMFFAAVLQPDIKNTVLTLVWFFFLGMSFFLGMVVWRTRAEQVTGIVLLLAPSLLLVHTWYHGIAVLLSGAALFSGIRSVQGEIDSRVRFHFFHNAQAGAFWFVFGCSLALSSMYFSSIRAESWEELVPRFSVGEGTASVLIRTVAYLFPQWQNLAHDGMTVDGFLQSLKPDENASVQSLPDTVEGQLGGPVTSQALVDYLRQGTLTASGVDPAALSEELALRTGREQIALLVGRPVEGDEKIADVFSLAIQHKIIVALSGDQTAQHLSPTIVPVVLAFLLFLTLLPAGSLLAFLCIGVSYLLFQIALFFGWLRLEQVDRKQDVLLA